MRLERHRRKFGNPSATAFFFLFIFGGVLFAADEPDCLKCHTPIQTVLQKKVKHPAMDMGCTSCHVNHQEKTSGGQKPAEHFLTSPAPEICFTCHDAKDLADAHRKQPFEKAACTECHDPHASDSPKLLLAQRHKPYADRQCDACHQPAEGGKVKLVAASAGALCLKCHAAMATRLTTAKAKHTVLESNPDACVDCHSPHGSANRFFLRKPEPALCADCHDQGGTDKSFLHEPVRQGCSLCHDAHASDSTKHLYSDVNATCLECHGLKTQNIAPNQLFHGHAALTAETFAQLKRLPLSEDGKTGHPFPGHPVSAAAQKDKPEMNCITCHQPHSGNGGPRMFVTEKTNKSLLCVKCH